jgi:GH24 family phage-related lysozyme (muramidase)
MFRIEMTISSLFRKAASSIKNPVSSGIIKSCVVAFTLAAAALCATPSTASAAPGTGFQVAPASRIHAATPEQRDAQAAQQARYEAVRTEAFKIATQIAIANEGYSPRLDGCGSIGYGHEPLAGEKITGSTRWSEAKARAVLAADLQKAEDVIIQLGLDPALSDNAGRRAAMISLAFNGGPGLIVNSGLHHMVKHERHTQFVATIAKLTRGTVIVDGVKVKKQLANLEKRRVLEVAAYEGRLMADGTIQARVVVPPLPTAKPSWAGIQLAGYVQKLEASKKRTPAAYSGDPVTPTAPVATVGPSVSATLG